MKRALIAKLLRWKALCGAMALMPLTAIASDVDAVLREVSIYGNGSTGSMAPYLIGALNHGKNAQRGALLLDAKAAKGMDMDSRVSWGAAAEVIAGDSYTSHYDRYDADADAWRRGNWHPGDVRLHQLYVEGKYRSIFLTVGLKEHGSALLNQELSSGDMVESGNARPIPEARIGFVDFQDIPFTKGWAQIQGEVSYGKMIDYSYLKRQFNYYDYHINRGALYTYKRVYFRSKPSERLCATFGMQAGAMFGGTTTYYSKGEVIKTSKFSRSIGTFFKMLLPMGENGEEYYVGSTLGSWDLKLRYRLNDSHALSVYFQGLWEDGSSLGRMNKWDGLYGIEYSCSERGWITGAVLEYIDFRDQSGPIHYDPADNPQHNIQFQTTGGDNYYNNNYYNSYANFGQCIGSPFLVSPIYNSDGYPAFASNRNNGFHAGISGQPAEDVKYKLLASYQRGLGTYTQPYYQALTDFSMMLQVDYNASAWVKGLAARAQVAFDCGKLRGDNFGTSLSLTYRF